MAEWALYYWPGFKGRGEMVRLMFEDAGVAYKDVGNQEGGGDEVKNFFFGDGQKDLFPARAPPAVKKGDFVLGETTAILSYLGKVFGHSPADPEDSAHVDQLLAHMADLIAEGFKAFRPKNGGESYQSQKEEADVAIKAFTSARLPAFIAFLEKALAKGKGYMVGDSISAADYMLLYTMQALEAQLPEAYSSMEAPGLKAHVKKIAERPNIKAYQASDRCLGWMGEGLM